jgi:hypothetical protein
MRLHAPIAAHLFAGWFFPGQGVPLGKKGQAPNGTPLNPGKNSGGSLICKQSAYYISFLGLGVSMRSYYKVSVSFKLSRGRPSLVSLSLHSSPFYFFFLVPSVSSLLSHSRFFHSVPEANKYIGYLFYKFPNCGLLRPVLDASQPTLFPVFAE